MKKLACLLLLSTLLFSCSSSKKIVQTKKTVYKAKKKTVNSTFSSQTPFVKSNLKLSSNGQFKYVMLKSSSLASDQERTITGSYKVVNNHITLKPTKEFTKITGLDFFTKRNFTKVSNTVNFTPENGHFKTNYYSVIHQGKTFLLSDEKYDIFGFKNIVNDFEHFSNYINHQSKDLESKRLYENLFLSSHSNLNANTKKLPSNYKALLSTRKLSANIVQKVNLNQNTFLINKGLNHKIVNNLLFLGEGNTIFKVVKTNSNTSVVKLISNHKGEFKNQKISTTQKFYGYQKEDYVKYF